MGRFNLGLGCGEAENAVPYGFDFSTPVARFEESLKVIRLLWESDGPVDFSGRFYKLHHARLDTEPFEGRNPGIWIGGSGPRVLDIAGRYADGWWPQASGPHPRTTRRNFRLYEARRSVPDAIRQPSCPA